MKKSRTPSKKELKAMRKASNIPEEVQRHLDRGQLPFIEVGTVSGSWRIEFVCEFGMYRALDEIPVAIDSDGNLTYYGDAYKSLGNLINSWFAYTSTVGDAEYQADVVKAMERYLSRMAKAGKKPLSAKENESVLTEAEDNARHEETLKNMLNEIEKEDGKTSD